MVAKSIILERKGEKDGFAQRFGKEIPEGTLVFLEGKEGAGKSIFCQRFCYSFLKNGSSCSYVSTQYTIQSFLRQTASVGYDARKYLMAGKLLFISTSTKSASYPTCILPFLTSMISAGFFDINFDNSFNVM